MKWNIALEIDKLDFEDKFTQHNGIAVPRDIEEGVWYIVADYGNRVMLVPYEEALAKGYLSESGTQH